MNHKEFRLNNLVQNDKGIFAKVQLLDCEYQSDKPIRAWYIERPAFGTEEPEPIPLTKEIARDFGFKIVDMGDHWEFNLGNFQLIQIKSTIKGTDLPPFIILHGKVTRRITVKYVHKLQNLFFELEEKELIYNPKA